MRGPNLAACACERASCPSGHAPVPVTPAGSRRPGPAVPARSPQEVPHACSSVRPDPVGTGRPATGRHSDRRTAQPRSAPREPWGRCPRVPRPRRRPPRQGRAGPPDQPRPPDGLIRIRAAGVRGGGRPARPGGAPVASRTWISEDAAPSGGPRRWIRRSHRRWSACSTTTSASGSPASAARPTVRATSPPTRSSAWFWHRSQEQRPERSPSTARAGAGRRTASPCSPTARVSR